MDLKLAKGSTLYCHLQNQQKAENREKTQIQENFTYKSQNETPNVSLKKIQN